MKVTLALLFSILSLSGFSQSVTVTSGSTTLAGTTSDTAGAWQFAQQAGDATTTGQTLVDSGLVVTLSGASTVWEFEAVLNCTTTAVTTGTEYGVNITGTGPKVNYVIMGALTSTTGAITSGNALSTASAAFLTTSSQSGTIVIKGIATTGIGSGNLSIQHLKVTSGTSTIQNGSILKYRRIL